MTANHCVHYSHPGADPVCALGVDIERAFRPCWPCWTGNKLPESSAICERFLAPTAEQLAAHQAEVYRRTEMMFTALVAIEQWEQAQPKRAKDAELRGMIDCPCCKAYGALAILIDRYHMYAQCKTPECVKFRGNRRR